MKLNIFSLNFPKIIRFIGNALFLIFFLLVLIDPANTLLHKKDIIFILLFGYCILFYKPDLSKIPFIGSLVIAVLIPYLISTMGTKNIDMEDIMHVFKSITPSILLLWVHHFDLLKLSRIPTIIVCLIMDILFLSIIFVPETEGAIYFVATIESDNVMMAHRWFIGFEVFCMYLKSTVAMILPMALYIYYCVTKGERTWSRWIACAIILFYFTFSGTRTTMLVPFFIIGITIYTTFKDNPKAKLFFYPILLIGGIMFLYLIFLLASDTHEASNLVKYGHIASYTELFENNPIYLLTGQGPGAYFYSEGFGKYVLQTEWTYLELVRWFGVFSILIVGVFFWPLITFWKYRSDNLTFSLLGAYLAYLIIAGTNPLMLSSTGMMALIIAYSYRDHIINKFN